MFKSLLILTLVLATYAQAKSYCPSLPANSSTPVSIPFFDLPTVYATSVSGQDTAAANQISNTLALYPLALDGKNYAALSEVFTNDVVANYSAPLGVLTGLAAVEATVAASLLLVTTQHMLGTQAIDVKVGSCYARSVTYLTATHFGKGQYEGQVVYAYGEYQDNWTKGEDGKWKIYQRTLAYLGPLIGNLSIFQIE